MTNLAATRERQERGSALENGFPCGKLSEIAELESYRKELNRPIYYLHKWWARRLGSVFRAAILGAATSPETNVMECFYTPVDLEGLIVYDPFMGSGTTIGEAHKLGCTALGRDINPVAYRAVRAALGPLSRREIVETYEKLSCEVEDELRELYTSTDSFGDDCEVLYYFWVKTAQCLHCESAVDLFKSYVFASHAYPKRHPEVQVLCPACDEIFKSCYKAGEVDCPHCSYRFDQDSGPTRRTKATCPTCESDFRIAEAARSGNSPPDHRLYAKLVLRRDGEKEYLAITEEDRRQYEQAGRRLEDLNFSLEQVPIPPGHNTDQVRNYGYRYWNEFFNDRQLLGLTLLGRAISDLPDGTTKDAFACLFSGVLEFNNMFASYKGEGTGAVRHMFSHHILKPERTPLEANIWGTPKSSGAFSTLYESRLLRALDYRENSFELAPDPNHTGSGKRSVKRYGTAPPIGAEIKSFSDPIKRDGSIHLSCGNSAASGLPNESVDLVVTDPPFFDNVHYSELADFFFAWQQQLFGRDSDEESEVATNLTTRRKGEVQDVAPRAFADKLKAVFSDCHRVLSKSGRLVFSYHHSRKEGWTAVARAVSEAGFTFIASQPVKAEMSNATPKSQASSPIDIDVLLVCQKRVNDNREPQLREESFESAVKITREKIRKLNAAGRLLSGGDVRVVLGSQLLVGLSGGRSSEELMDGLRDQLGRAWQIAEELAERQTLGERDKPSAPLFDGLDNPV